MPFTVVVTRNVPDRTRGFLASVMLEIAPTVYVSPNMTSGVRDRVWNVMLEWSSLLPADGGVLMTFPDRSAPSGQAIWLVGFPKTALVDVDGLWLVCRALSPGGPEKAGSGRPRDVGENTPSTTSDGSGAG